MIFTCLFADSDPILEYNEFHSINNDPHSTSTFAEVCQLDELVLINDEVIKVPDESVSDDGTIGSDRILAYISIIKH